MKFIVLSFLFILVSCNGNGGGINGGSENITSGNSTSNNSADEQAAKVYISQSTQTLPPELKISQEDNTLIKSEVSLTTDESNTLNQL